MKFKVGDKVKNVAGTLWREVYYKNIGIIMAGTFDKNSRQNIYSIKWQGHVDNINSPWFEYQLSSVEDPNDIMKNLL